VSERSSSPDARLILTAGNHNLYFGAICYPLKLPGALECYATGNLPPRSGQDWRSWRRATPESDTVYVGTRVAFVITCTSR
jgi:hypothetical protein